MNKEINYKRRKLRWFAAILFAAVSIMIGIVYFPSFFLKQTVEIQVVKIDSPRSCRDSSSFILGKRGRSSEHASAVSYCGFVMTSHGSLFLPETVRFALLGNSREEMYDRLQEGCTYIVETVGYGQDIGPSEFYSNIGKRDLVSVSEKIEC